MIEPSNADLDDSPDSVIEYINALEYENKTLQEQAERLRKAKLYRVGLLNHIPIKVIDVINAEIVYQDNKWGEQHNRNQTVEGHLLILEEKLLEARKGWAKNLTGRNSVESEITQVAAVAIQALINLHNAGRL